MARVVGFVSLAAVARAGVSEKWNIRSAYPAGSAGNRSIMKGFSRVIHSVIQNLCTFFVDNFCGMAEGRRRGTKAPWINTLHF